MNPKKLIKSQLTDIYQNRLAFHQAINQRIAHAKQHNHKMGLLLIDLDNFRSINHHLGHQAGDTFLLKIQEQLTSCLSPNDFITRIDGDEFGIILGNFHDPLTVETSAHKLMSCFTESYDLNGTHARVNASIGAAFYPSAGTDAHTLLQSAAISMHHAKSLGGNNYQYHTKELNKTYKKKSYLENALKFALEKNELYLNYQPIFNLTTKKIVGIEALLRWRHPRNRPISPDVFIALAEKNGLMPSIGEWALETVCEQAKQWYHVCDIPFKIYFNISSHQLLRKSFPQFILRLLKKTGISANLLDLELTETAFITKSSYFKSILKKISNSGIRITIDDFGIGHSSLTRLKNLPIKTLKIDKSFVSDIIPDSFDAIIVKSLIHLGKKLDMNVIAEGIETEAHLQFLIKNGCPQGQGYYLCKPLSAEQMMLFLKNFTRVC